MTRTLLIKFGALGDVLRTTSVLAGLRKKHGPDHQLVWVTAPGAVPLIEGLRRPSGLIHAILPVELEDGGAVEALGAELARADFDQVLSFDDERAACALATRAARDDEARILGAFLAADGTPTYTDSAAEWFDMGLLSKLGKAAADRLKIENRRSHAAIFASMLGIEAGEPALELDDAELVRARARLEGSGTLVGLNTGAGGRWRSKALPEERVVGLALELARRLDSPRFVLLGGPEEEARNASLRRALEEQGGLGVIDPGCHNSLVEFGALVDALDVIVTSDSLAMHMAIARRVPTVAFFAPTSAAEIDLFGRGEKVVSTAPDACSYARDADTSTLTVERLAAAVCATLGTKSQR